MPAHGVQTFEWPDWMVQWGPFIVTYLLMIIILISPSHENFLHACRVRWAVDRTQQFPAGSGVECNYNDFPQKVKTADLPSSRAPAAHIRFSSLKPGIVITEMSLRKLFSQYGDILDCTIKQSKTSSKVNSSSWSSSSSYSSSSRSNSV